MSKTVVWDASTGEFVEAPQSIDREVAIQQILKDLQDDPASDAVQEERERARRRWADLSS